MSRRFFCTVLLIVTAIFGLLAVSGILLAQGPNPDSFERVREAQERHTNGLLAIDGVEGTAIGLNENGRLAVKVFTARQGVAGIPKTLDGIPVKVVVSGKFYALPMPDTPPGQEKQEDEVDPTVRFERPVPIGVSTGHPLVTAGTIGCRVKDSVGNIYALSNNHVYADENQASIGDNVLQPGRVDGGVDPDDAIGTLTTWVPIVFYDPDNPPDPVPTNEIDAAIAKIIIDEIDETTVPRVDNATPIDGYGIPSSTTTTASLGLEVQKYGRTTGFTRGTVSEVNFIGNVGYSTGTARFVGQIVIVKTIGTKGRFSKGGDSGSLIVTDDENRNPVGLLFAGGGRWTIANPIGPVLEAFEVTIDGEE
jgi:hypothetical protein